MTAADGGKREKKEDSKQDRERERERETDGVRKKNNEMKEKLGGGV